ncbi:MAG: O-antigen ligase family protein [Actinobacteria bacterium]|nr:O-antigen ligase family protein [Actinomycetota bacterium]
MSSAAFGHRSQRYGLRRAGRVLASTLTSALALATVAALGVLTVVHPRYGFLAGVLVALAGIIYADPLLIPVAVFPDPLLLQRAGGGAGAGLALCDLAVVAGAAVAITKIRWEAAPTLRKALLLIAVFEAILLLTVIANPNKHDALEWAHRIEMLGGTLLVGWVVAASGRARQAVSLLVAGSVVLALVTLEHAVTLHFHPAQFGVYQKNFIGSTMWMAIVVAHLNPSWLDLPKRLARAAKYVCGLALLASQSKQAIIALVVVLLYVVLRQPNVRRRSKLLLGALVPMAIVGYLLITREVANLAVNPNNSLGARLTSFSADFHIWASSPIFGQGMRWFYLPQFSSYIQPPNIFMESLVAGGVVGVIALTLLLGGSSRILLSMPHDIGTIALVLILGRVIESMFDIYWTSGGSLLPWLVAGLALGTWDAVLAGRVPSTASSWQAPVPARTA